MSHFTVALLTNKYPSSSVIEEMLEPFYEGKSVPLYISKTKEEIIESERKHLENIKNTSYAEYIKDPEAYEKKYSYNKGHIRFLKEEFISRYNSSDEDIYKGEIKYYEDDKISEKNQIINSDSITFEIKDKKIPSEIYSFLKQKDKKAIKIRIVLEDDKSNIIFTKTIKNDLKNILDDLRDNCTNGVYTVKKEEIAPEGAILSNYNPLSKWDWYSIGGRWSGEMPIRSDAEVEDCNSCKLKDVIWLMEELLEEKYIKDTYDQYVEACKEEGRTSEEIIDFRSYVENNFKFSTYAVLDENGAWHEPGKMLYFGMSTASEEDSDLWHESFYDSFIKNRNPETYITLIDCHI